MAELTKLVYGLSTHGRETPRWSVLKEGRIEVGKYVCGSKPCLGEDSTKTEVQFRTSLKLARGNPPTISVERSVYTWALSCFSCEWVTFLSKNHLFFFGGGGEY